MQEFNRENLKNEMLSIWTIWGCILLSLFIYARVPHWLGGQAPYLVQYNLPLQLIKYAFFALALISLYQAYRFRKRMFGSPLSKYDEKIVERAKKTNKSVAVVKCTNIVIITIAYLESIGILGLCYFFLSKDYYTVYFFIGVSVIAMLYYRPKSAELEKLAAVTES